MSWYGLVCHGATVWYGKDGPTNGAVAVQDSAVEYDIVLHGRVWSNKTHPQKSYMVRC